MILPSLVKPVGFQFMHIVQHLHPCGILQRCLVYGFVRCCLSEHPLRRSLLPVAVNEPSFTHLSESLSHSAGETGSGAAVGGFLQGLTGLCRRLAAPDGSGTLGRGALAFGALHHPAFCGRIHEKRVKTDKVFSQKFNWSLRFAF